MAASAAPAATFMAALAAAAAALLVSTFAPATTVPFVSALGPAVHVVESAPPRVVVNRALGAQLLDIPHPRLEPVVPDALADALRP